MWTTLPSSENVPFLDFVKSMNCDGKAKCPGSNSSLRLPTADGAIILLMPNSLNAQIFALKFIKCGGIVCFFPCLGINAIFFPSNFPIVITSDVLPSVSYTHLRAHET